LQEKWIYAYRKLKQDSCLAPYNSNNSKWIKDLNIRLKTLKLVEERTGNTVEAIGVAKNFLRRTQAAQQLRKRMDKWN
jgi:hypothetical protein